MQRDLWSVANACLNDPVLKRDCDRIITTIVVINCYTRRRMNVQYKAYTSLKIYWKLNRSLDMTSFSTSHQINTLPCFSTVCGGSKTFLIYLGHASSNRSPDRFATPFIERGQCNERRMSIRREPTIQQHSTIAGQSATVCSSGRGQSLI